MHTLLNYSKENRKEILTYSHAYYIMRNYRLFRFMG